MAERTSQMKTLQSEKLDDFVSSLLDVYHVFAPVHGSDRLVKIDAPHSVHLHRENTTLSPKDLFLPQTETLLVFDGKTRRALETEDGNFDKPLLLFGIHPCDARAFALMDRVFMDDAPHDPYYVKRRESAVTISLACTHPSPTCFCTSVGCAPDAEEGADIILFELERRFLLKTLTPRGDALVERAQSHLQDATEQDKQEKDLVMKAANEKVARCFDSEELCARLDEFDAPYWQQLHQKCLGCGVCTFLCPTCHCFDITDEVLKQRGRRVRTWDSCMFPLFTQHASGHNPRPTQKERLRQRIMHKFSYARKCYDETFCVGCGRCILYCPVNIDIRQLIREIVEVQ
jgi:Pyruvate/2-oxoacid:ferredoxin oxidoreductase delta subunit